MSGVIEDFTTKVPYWQPRVKPIDLDKATEAQREALKITPSGTKVSEYVLVLANDVETLAVRSPLFNAIMYDKGGLSRAERELGALGASVVNRCVYCAAVHASRYNQLTKDETVVAEIFDKETEAELSGREAAIYSFAMKLARTPSEADASDIAACKAAGLDEAELLDLVLSSALFGWANRLMHTLGDPVERGSAA